jgi:rhodanese-related sulfurtransferase
MTTALIDSAALRSRLDRDATVRLVDVRTASEYETAHIPGSYHVPLDSFGQHSADLRNVSGDIVLVCQSGGRAKQAAEKLSSAGVSNVTVLDGGLGAWLASGGEANRGKERWSLERQVRLVAGTIVLTSVLGSVAKPKLKWVAGAVGGGLTFAAVSNTCMMASLLAKLPYNRQGARTETSEVVAALVDQRPAP